jgi:hypothetical protein
MKTHEMFEILSISLLPWQNILVTKELASFWCKAFEDVSKEEFGKAMIATLKTNISGFPPTIGQVNEMLQHTTAPVSEQLTEGEAWNILIQAVKRFGNYRRDEAFKWMREQSERVARCAEIMDWNSICLWETRDQPANRAHFWKVLSGLEQRDRRNDLLGLPRRDVLAELNSKAATSVLVGNLVKTLDMKQSEKDSPA